jgi:hypothetical protein
MLSKFKHNFNILKKMNHFKNSLLKKNLKKLNHLLKVKLIKLNFLSKKKKLTAFTIDKRAFLFVLGVIFFILSYLSIPYFYNSNKLIDKIEGELSKNLNIDFNLSKNFRYSFFPRPYFTFEKASFLNQFKNSGKIKVDIPISKLLFLEHIQIKDVVLSDVNFDINNENNNFFTDLLKNDFSNFKFEIYDSNIFYRNIKNDVLFINKINYLKYYYDKKIFSNIFIADNEIFNLFYNIKFKNDFVNKKITSIINSSSLNIKIENNLDYKNLKKKEGLISFIYNKKKSNATYNYNKDSFKFNLSDRSIDPNFIYKGTVNLKPFFSESRGLFKKVHPKEFLDPNSILVQFLKTEILNNKNLNMNIYFNAKQLNSIEDIENLALKVKISEGLIDINETTISWLDTADLRISDSLIYVKNNNLVLDCLVTIQINNYNEFYKFFQTPKNYRKEIKKIQFNLSYNFDQFTANLNDIKIDKIINQKVNKTLKQLIFKENKLQNRIYFRVLMNQAIKSYAG